MEIVKLSTLSLYNTQVNTTYLPPLALGNHCLVHQYVKVILMVFEAYTC